MQTEMSGHAPLKRLVATRSSNSYQQGGVVNEVMHVKQDPSPVDYIIQKNFLPINFVSIPVEEDGHITLKNQTTLCNSDSVLQENSPSTEKKWHHKAIRRNISKVKELILLVGGLPNNLTNDQYTDYAMKCTNEKSSIGPIFSTVGCFIITFASGVSAYNAMKMLKQTQFRGKIPKLQLIPYINMPPLASKHNCPLLVFINCKSGGGQGAELYELMKKSLNPNQVFLMEHSGAIPGLFAFRKLPRFRILVCGGDGTAGWVLSHIEVVQTHLACQSPSVAILPVGTGNDLARVLGSGSSWSGDSISQLLTQYEDLQPFKLDRWNLLFDSVARPVKTKQGSKQSSAMLFSDAVSITDVPKKNLKTRKPPTNVVMSIGGNSVFYDNLNTRKTSDHQKSEFKEKKFNSSIGKTESQIICSNNKGNALTLKSSKTYEAEDKIPNEVEIILELLIRTVEHNKNNDLTSKDMVSKYHEISKHDNNCDNTESCQNKSIFHPHKSKTVEYKKTEYANGNKGFRHFHSEKIQSSTMTSNGYIDKSVLDEETNQYESNYSVPVRSTFKTETIEKKITELPSGLKLMSMNNYMGIGIDAELSLAFHVARLENPEFCTSRLRNKAMYFKAGLKKMTTRSSSLHNIIELEVDGIKVQLPSIKGIIFLNIESWAGGANPWGQSRKFDPPSFGDGKLEVIGVGGVAHMSQIYSGLRNGFKIAQGENFRITMKEEVAVQVDGEPWLQPPGKIIITAAHDQATMLKKIKKKSLKK